VLITQNVIYVDFQFEELWKERKRYRNVGELRKGKGRRDVEELVGGAGLGPKSQPIEGELDD